MNYYQATTHANNTQWGSILVRRISQWYAFSWKNLGSVHYDQQNLKNNHDVLSVRLFPHTNHLLTTNCWHLTTRQLKQASSSSINVSKSGVLQRGRVWAKGGGSGSSAPTDFTSAIPVAIGHWNYSWTGTTVATKQTSSEYLGTTLLQSGGCNRQINTSCLLPEVLWD